MSAVTIQGPCANVGSEDSPSNFGRDAFHRVPCFSPTVRCARETCPDQVLLLVARNGYGRSLNRRLACIWWRRRCGWPPKACGRRKTTLENSTGAGKPGWAVPKPSPPWRTLERLGKPLKECGGAEGPQGRASGSERVHLARILWHLLKYKQPFNPEVFAKEEEKMKRKKLQRLQNMAASLNDQLVPQP